MTTIVLVLGTSVGRRDCSDHLFASGLIESLEIFFSIIFGNVLEKHSVGPIRKTLALIFSIYLRYQSEIAVEETNKQRTTNKNFIPVSYSY